VSIDVNSGRATKERHIEETALKTNLEAAEEVARQLRLRDLGGLVVIDFIDMEDHRNNAKVERKLRDALSTDRARIQVGRISSFGLLELSRQRLHPSLTEAQFEKCPHCKGVGYIRTIDSASILALRSLEEEGIRSRAAQVFLSVPNEVALYILNQKREMLADIERRYGFTVFIRVDEELAPTGFKLETVKASASDDEESDVIEQDSETMDFVDEAIASEEGNSSSKTEDGEEGQSRGGRAKNPRGRKDGGRGRNRRDGGRDKDGNRSPRRDEDSSSEPTESSAVAVPVVQEKQEKAEKDTGFRAKRFRARTPSENAQSPAEPATAVSSASPSNDVGNAQTDSGDNASSDSKKRGWWNRLIE
jgi:ribonuclease E